MMPNSTSWSLHSRLLLDKRSADLRGVPTNASLSHFPLRNVSFSFDFIFFSLPAALMAPAPVPQCFDWLAFV
jgi:hypothetical protein